MNSGIYSTKSPTTNTYTQLIPQQKKIRKMKFQIKPCFTYQHKFYADLSPLVLKQFSSDLVDF